MSEPRRSRRRAVGELLTGHALPLLVVAVFLLPLLWMVTASLRDTGLPPPRSIEWLPQSLSLDNLAAVFELQRDLAGRPLVIAEDTLG